MIRTARFVLGAVVVGLAVTFGCLVPVHYSDEGLGGNVGQGGTTATTATASTGSSGGGQLCSMTLPCKSDNNACTTDVCVEGFCSYDPLTAPIGPDSTTCLTVPCVNGASTTPTPHAGVACGNGLSCNAMGQCADCKDASTCPVPPNCKTVTCVNTVCEVTSVLKGTPPGSIINTTNDCKKPICDGNGNIDFAFDDGDVPIDDNNPCTDQVCVMGAPMYPPAVATGIVCKSMANPSAKVCDGNGACVECTANGDCKGLFPSCDTMTLTCISCSDMKQNGAETGLDCGGACPKCDGDVCGQPQECKSLACMDKLCCDKACLGNCVACDLPGKKGVCTPVFKGLEDSICKGNGKACTGAGTCASGIMGKAGDICSKDADCYADACNGMCRLPNFAPCAEDAACASLHCVGNVCAACATGNDCTSNVCNAGQCKVAGGGVCSDFTDCAAGVCGIMNTCGRINGASCVGDADCLSSRCISQVCVGCAKLTGGTDCVSHVCNAIGNCRLPVNGFCTDNSQCASNLCKGFPARCQ